MDVQVQVPATVANLGPGFDCLGSALGAHLQVKLSPAETSEIVGDVADLGRNLTHRAFLEAHKISSVDAPQVRIEVVEQFASARGLGASAAAIVAGLVGARHFSDLEVSDADLARAAVRIEGHADNVLAAMFGGVVLSSGEGWMRFDPSEEITPLVLVSPQKFKTSDARAVLPSDIPRADAVANSAATAALVAVLTGAQPADGLLMATEDRVHEPYRLPMMKATMDLHGALRGHGIAAALAGAGPSLICLVTTSPSAGGSGGSSALSAPSPARQRAANPRDQSGPGSKAGALEFISGVLPAGWEILDAGWDLKGAQVR